MKDKINGILNQIEEEYGIRILFAVESGSRVWRLESKDSDYDVRFVYVRPKKDYLRINQQAEVLDKTVGNVDMVGFDIMKFMRLLINSNPSVIEWLNSDIIYKDESIGIPTYESKNPVKFKCECLKFITERFNPIALYHHYRSMCKQNYLKYLKSRSNLSYKKYLYAMRGLVNALVVRDFSILPPIDFNETLGRYDETSNTDLEGTNIPQNIIKKLQEIIELKKSGKEIDQISNIEMFDTYIESFLKTEEKIDSKKMTDYQHLQQLVWKAVL